MPGIVLGSSWRMGHRMLRLDEQTGAVIAMPERDTYTPLFEPIEPLVRRALLYFDRLDWPENNVVPQGELLHADYLKSRRVFARSRIEIPGVTPQIVELIQCMARNQISLGGQLVPLMRSLAKTHVDIFKQREAAEPGSWSFATIGQGLDLPSDLIVRQRGAEMELYNCLPVPSDGVPYEDILEFKDHRCEALLELRGRMDESYDAIIKSTDIPRTKTVELERLERALAVVERLLTERRLPFALEPLRVDLSFGSLVEAATKGSLAGAFAQTYGLPFQVTAPLVGALSLFKFEGKTVESPLEKAGAFGYVYLAHRESIVS